MNIKSFLNKFLILLFFFSFISLANAGINVESGKEYTIKNFESGEGISGLGGPNALFVLSTFNVCVIKSTLDHNIQISFYGIQRAHPDGYIPLAPNITANSVGVVTHYALLNTVNSRYPASPLVAADMSHYIVGIEDNAYDPNHPVTMTCYDPATTRVNKAGKVEFGKEYVVKNPNKNLAANLIVPSTFTVCMFKSNMDKDVKITFPAVERPYNSFNPVPSITVDAHSETSLVKSGLYQYLGIDLNLNKPLRFKVSFEGNDYDPNQLVTMTCH